MKMLFLISTFLLLSSAFAKECEVYGISDSPQKLSCTFPGHTLDLTCRNGEYFLNSTKVTMAYHLEVEDGPTPLVFKTKDSELTVVIQPKADILAEYVRNRTHISGTCL